MSSQIFECIKECINLSKLKENETTWSKIDKLFLSLLNTLNIKEDSELFIKSCTDLLCRSIVSDRSKLSGTSLNLLKKLSDILHDDLKLNIILPSVLKVCGRSNKVVFSRGHDTIEHLSKNIDISPYIKILNEHYNSINKNIRLGVVKGIMASDDRTKFIKIIEKAKTDQFIEIRNLVKSSYNVEIPKFVPKQIMKKELSPQKQIISPFVPKHSPYKKIIKSDLESNTVCEKITELEKQVNLIANEKPKVERPRFKVISTKQYLPVKKEKKDLDDDLTPRKLDRYLSKYRNIYGNILDENKEEEINFYENNTKPHKKEISNSEKNLNNEMFNQGQNFNDTDLNLGNNIIDEKIHSIEENKTIIKNDIYMGSSDKNISSNILSNSLQLKSKEEIDLNLSKDLSNLSITEENMHFDYTILNSENNNLEKIQDKNSSKKVNSSICEKQINLVEENEILDVIQDYEKCQSEKESNEKFVSNKNDNQEFINKKTFVQTNDFVKSNTTKINLNEKDLNCEINIDDQKDEIKNVKLHISSTESTPSVKNNSLHVDYKNRFAAFLFSDKDECVIYDINSDSPQFKNIQKENLEMQSSVNLKQSELSSSFLYSNNIEKKNESKKNLNNNVENIIGDYSKIDSCIYVDKSTFKKNKD